MIQLILTRDALTDVLEISEWYEEQTEGTGERFLKALDDKFEMIRQNPEIHRTLPDSPIRKSKVENWPYQVFFAIRNRVAEVIAIIHTSRDASYISERTQIDQ